VVLNLQAQKTLANW